jgi:hypothetical protein
MKIKIFHDVCGREVLVQQILASEGHCPWDGKSFSRDYTAVLAEALEAAEIAGGALENALEKVADMHPAFRIEEQTVLEGMQEQFRRINGRTGDRRTR